MLKDIKDNRHFCYTQQSLDTFEKCPLKFKKRYVEGLRWDSVPDEEARVLLDRGNSFHLLACRYFSGIPRGIYGGTRDGELLAKWLRNLESYFEKRTEEVYLPEYSLRAQLDGFRLEANVDLIILKDSQLTIWDWKTHRPKADEGNSAGKKLKNSLQTMVYLYVLREQISALGFAMAKDTPISMKYWQPDPPQVISEVTYDAPTHERFRTYLRQLLLKIEGYDYSGFDKALYRQHCKYCEFNWHCNGRSPMPDD